MSVPGFRFSVDVQDRHIGELMRVSRARIVPEWRRIANITSGPLVCAALGTVLCMYAGADAGLGAAIGAVSSITTTWVTYLFIFILRRKEFEPGGPSLGTTDVVADETGIERTRKFSRSWTGWSGIRGIVMAPSTMILMTDRAGGIVIPRSALPPQEFEAFRAYIAEHIEKAQQEQTT